MAHLPLQGLKVLDLSRVLAGPYCTQILGDLGAAVTKIEEPLQGDDTRSWGPPFFDATSVYFLSANRNKKSLFLNLKNPKDLKKILALAKKADVLIENFKVGNLKKYGLDFPFLSKLNPKLVYCSVTGFGQDGPLAREPGYDLMIQGMGGLMSITGPDDQHPFKVGVAIADLSAGLYATIGILAALKEREKSKKGQHIDISLLDTQVSQLSYIAMNYLATQNIPQPLGNAHPSITPYQAFDTLDRPIVLAIGNEHQFELLSKTLKSQWHKDSRFKTNSLRTQNRNALSGLIQKKLKAKTRAKWLKDFGGKGFPFGPINNLREVFENPQVIARGLATRMSDGKTPCIKSPLRFSRTPIQKYRVPPKFRSK